MFGQFPFMVRAGCGPTHPLPLSPSPPPLSPSLRGCIPPSRHALQMHFILNPKHPKHGKHAAAQGPPPCRTGPPPACRTGAPLAAMARSPTPSPPLSPGAAPEAGLGLTCRTRWPCVLTQLAERPPSARRTVSTAASEEGPTPRRRNALARAKYASLNYTWLHGGWGRGERATLTSRCLRQKVECRGP